MAAKKEVKNHLCSNNKNIWVVHQIFQTLFTLNNSNWVALKYPFKCKWEHWCYTGCYQISKISANFYWFQGFYLKVFVLDLLNLMFIQKQNKTTIVCNWLNVPKANYEKKREINIFFWSFILLFENINKTISYTQRIYIITTIFERQ